jgi:hypothetical protein
MNHVSTLLLHRLRLGELAADEQDVLEAHLATCSLCAGRLAHQQQLRAAFVRAPMPAALEPRPTLWERIGQLRALLLFVPIALAALLVLKTGPLASPGAAPALTEHLKGATPQLVAWVKTGESARPLYTDERVHEGTRVQLRYDAGRHRFVTLAGRDGRGLAEVYGTVPADGPGVRDAPFALTLDGTRGDQTFFAILTDTRPQPEEVMAALAESPVRMDHGEIASLVLRKE